MFVGHVAVGLAAKRLVPQVSLAVLVLAAQLADALWPVLVGLGLERVAIDPGNTAVTPLDFIDYPYSHSLVLLTLWGIVFAAAFARLALPVRRRPGQADSLAPRRATVFVVLAVLVISHWVLDFVTHRPDLPLYPGGAKFGLGLWNSVPATVAVELLMYGAGLWIYLAATRPRDRVGRWAFSSLALFLLIAYAVNLAGPPPPSVEAIWLIGVIGASLLTLWAWWADRHREVVVQPRLS